VLASGSVLRSMVRCRKSFIALGHRRVYVCSSWNGLNRFSESGAIGGQGALLSFSFGEEFRFLAIR